MSIFPEILGYIGAFCLLVCDIPQLLKIYKRKSVRDISIVMLCLWQIGAVSMFSYVMFTTQTVPLLITYGITSCVSTVMLTLYCKYKD